MKNRPFIQIGKTPSKKPARIILVASILAMVSAAQAENVVWNNATSGGFWNTSTNWTGGVVADGNTNIADFSTLDIIADNLVRLDGSHTINGLIFGDATTLSNGWTLDNNATAANILTLGGATPTITVNALGAGKTATISAVVAGSAGLTKAGTGTLVLSATNTYTGATMVNNGVLQIGATAAVPTASLVTVASGATFNTAGQTSARNVLSISGTGTTGQGAIYNSSTSEGSVGNVTLAADASVGSVGKFNFYGTISGANTLTTAAGSIVDIRNANAITGLAGMNLNGWVIVEGNQNWAGPYTVNSTGALGAFVGTANKEISGSVTLNGGTLFANGSVNNTVTFSGPINVQANSTIGSNAITAGSTAGGGSIAITGIMSGNGGITFGGNKSTTLSAANTYTGVTTILNGAVNVSAISDGGVAGNLGQATNVASNLIFGKNGATTGQLNYTGAGEDTDRLFTIDGHAIIKNNGTGALNFSNTGDIVHNNAGVHGLTLGGTNTGANTFASRITNGPGTVSVTKADAGTWTLSGANIYTGATTVSGGTLNLTGSLTSAVTVNSGGAISGSGNGTTTGVTTGLLTMNAGSFITLAGGATTSSITAAGVNFAGATNVLFNTPLVHGNTYDVVTYGVGTVSNFANLNGSAYRDGIVDDIVNRRITLTANVGTRTWNTAAGTWGFNTDANFAEGDQKFFSGDSVVFGGNTDSLITLNGRLTPSSVTVSNSTNTYTFSGTAGTNEITGTTSLTKSGAGRLVLSSANTYSGGTFINGGEISTGVPAALGTGAITMDGGALAVTVAGQTFTQNIVVGSTGATVDSSALGGTGTTALSGVISGTTSGLVLKGSGNLSATGGGDGGLGIRLANAANSFTGDVTVTAGLVSYANDSSFGDLGNKIILNGGGLLDNNLNIPLARDIQVLGGGGTFRTFGSTNVTWSGAISGAGNINRTDGGTLTLSGDLSAYAGTYANQGGNTTLTGTAPNIGGNWTVSAATLAVNSAANQTLAGNITVNGGTFAKTGSGSLTLSGALNGTAGASNFNGGATTLSNGGNFAGTLNVLPSAAGTTLNITGGAYNGLANIFLFQNSISNSLATYNQSGGTVNVTGSFQLGASTTGGSSNNLNIANITGGSLTAGTLHFYKWATSQMNISGGAIVTAGTFNFGHVDSSPAATIALGDGLTGGTLQWGDTTLQSTRNYTLNFNAGTIKATKNNATWVPATAFTKMAVQETGGTIDNGGFNVAIGQNLTHGGFNPIDGGLTFTGTGTTTLSGNNSYSGDTIVNGGSLLVNGSISGSADVNYGGILGGSGTVTGAVTVSAGGVISPGNSAGQLDTGSFNLNADAVFNVELGGTTAASGYDQLNVTGTVTLGGNLSLSLISGFIPQGGEKFWIGLNDNSDSDLITTAFANAPITNVETKSGTFSSGGYDWTVYYGANFENGQATVDGNDIMLMAVPEPTATTALLGGMGLLLARRRRRSA